MSEKLVMGIDQGTSGSRALLVDGEGVVRGYAYRPVPRLHPRPDWVEQDPLAVADGVAGVVTAALADAGAQPNQIAAVGIACQRNTDFVWDAHTRRPLANAITWQDMRTLPLLTEMERWPAFGEAHRRLGYPPAPYMSGLHLAWRMAHDPAVAAAAREGRLRVSMSAGWLVAALGEPAGHHLDASLIQATGLYDIRAGDYWEAWRCRLGGVPLAALPLSVPTVHPYGTIRLTGAGGQQADAPVLTTIGDQQASLFGHGARRPGDAACTHGTASYVEVFLGERAPHSGGLDTLCAWDLSGIDGRSPAYAYEAQTTVTGAVLRWMRESARLLADYDELDGLAGAVADSGGVTFVPAFTGLNVPYNDRHARGSLLGLTLGTTRGHIARAFLEAIGLQLAEIVGAVSAGAGVQTPALRVGGGLAASDVACQIQADVLGIPVLRPSFRETTAWGAVLLAGLGAGVWSAVDDLPPLPGDVSRFEPRWNAARRAAALDRWREAIELVRRYSVVTPPQAPP